jgi:hypothetical protein
LFESTVWSLPKRTAGIRTTTTAPGLKEQAMPRASTRAIIEWPFIYLDAKRARISGFPDGNVIPRGMRRLAVCAAGGTHWRESQGRPQGGRARAVDRPCGPRRPSGGACAPPGRGGPVRCVPLRGPVRRGVPGVRGGGRGREQLAAPWGRGPKRGAAGAGLSLGPGRPRSCGDPQGTPARGTGAPALWGLSWPSPPGTVMVWGDDYDGTP